MTIDAAKAQNTETDVAALARVAAARDICLGQSNRFLLVGIASAIFYSIKVAGLRIDLVIADTKVFETPYGLFVFGIVGAISFILAQLRYLDGKALDLELKDLCENSSAVAVNYKTFPSPHHWLIPAQVRFADRTRKTTRKFAFAILGLITFAIYLVPLFAATHFLIAWPKLADEQYTDAQWWIVFLVLVMACFSYILAQAVYSKR